MRKCGGKECLVHIRLQHRRHDAYRPRHVRVFENEVNNVCDGHARRHLLHERAFEALNIIRYWKSRELPASCRRQHVKPKVDNLNQMLTHQQRRVGRRRVGRRRRLMRPTKGRKVKEGKVEATPPAEQNQYRNGPKGVATTPQCFIQLF